MRKFGFKNFFLKCRKKSNRILKTVMIIDVVREEEEEEEKEEEQEEEKEEIILLFWEFFQPALADGFSLESEWQQVSSTLSILTDLNNAVI